ncbi:hypothetical protein M9458_043735, partial [Cirrhinus mrigala]
MSQISKDIEAMSSVSEEVSLTHAETPTETQLTITSTEQHPPVLSSNTAHRNDGLPPPDTIPINSVGTAPSLSANDMNPPEIQKVVVEHIVRSEAISPHFQPQLRLRSFSGKTPRPNNETDYDTWRSHIELLLNDPNILPLKITRKIVESLLSPAADVVKGLRPNSPPLAFLQLLDSAFGTVEDGEELFARFLNTFQNPGESASAYLHRLQVALNLVVKRGGVAPGELDRHLLKQFCRGCWDSALLSTLQLEQARSRPPSFAELLLMLRTEEDRQQAKASRMRKHIGATKRVQVQSQSACACANPKEKPQVCPSAIEDLVKQVATLQSQLTSFMAEKKKDRKVTAQKPQSRTPDKTNANMQTQIRTKQMNKPRPWYCFKCGEDGHISSTCTEAPNPALVAEKRKQLEKRLIKRLTAPVVGQTGAETNQCPSALNLIVNSQARTSIEQSDSSPPFKFPKGLIGTKSTAFVNIKDQEVTCLLDTGSQVTTIPQSFYERHLSEQEIKPLHDLLQVEGAAGQSVPYLGYIELAVTFPKEFVGALIEVNTLALVVPNLNTIIEPLVLIGTNTLDVLYNICSESGVKHQPIPHGYRAVLKVLEVRHNQTTHPEPHGVVKLLGKSAQIVPAGKTVVLEGVSPVNGFQNEKSVLIEHPNLPSLLGGLLVKAILVDLPFGRPYKLPVIICNESDHDVVIPPKGTIAQMHTYQTILLKQHNAESAEPSQKTAEAESSQKSTLSFNFGESLIPPLWKERITEKLNNMHDVFAKHDADFGRTDKVTHHIKLSDDTPFKQRARPIHPQDIEAVRNHIQELLDAGVIRDSESPFSSPIVVVRKKNGQVRLCIDYRRLNLQTIKDAYSLPKLEDTFCALNGSQWFSVLDLKSGFYQIEVEEADKPKTAFVCPLGFWEFNRMPQGVTNALSTFQRLMEKCMGDMHLKEVLVFLDDLIIFSKTLEEHEERLMKVLSRLKEFGLKLSPEKCVFFQTSVRYLGHVVSRNGVQTDPEKTAALKTWPIPKSLRELRSFLGFAGYYRRFVKGYSNIVKPLHELTSGYPPSQKRAKVTKRPEYRDPKEPFGERWTPACQQAFETVIEKLTTAPVLGFADPRKPYVLHTDASTTGLGAVLYQEQEGQLRAIGYASRGLSRSESRYPAHKLEFLALKWSVTEKFADYLYGNQFTVVTDSNPLTYILTSAKLDATSYRWLAALSTFSFKLLYRPRSSEQGSDGPLRTLHRDLLLPCGFLPMEESSKSAKQPTKRRIATRANPVLDADPSEEGEDKFIPVHWFSEVSNVFIPTVHEGLAQPKESLSDEQRRQYTVSPGPCSVESPVNAQTVDCPPELSGPSDMSTDAPVSPLRSSRPINHCSNTEHLPTESTAPIDQVPDTYLPEVHPVEKETILDAVNDICNEQQSVSSDMSEREEEVDRTKAEKSVEGEKPEMDGTESREGAERMTVTNAPVRKSKRDRQPP